MENLYSIKINSTGRYVKHCDEHWYETVGNEVRLFTKDQAQAIAGQLKKHYVYSVTISNGTEKIDTRLDKVKKEKMLAGLKNFKVTLKARNK